MNLLNLIGRRLEIFFSDVIKNERFFSAFTNYIGEKGFIFGSNLKKETILKISKNAIENDGIILIGVNNLPIGFGELIQSSICISRIKNRSLLIINQGDIGRYIRTL
jgi:60S ribosome subunit biogenesis protein NIP7